MQNRTLSSFDHSWRCPGFGRRVKDEQNLWLQKCSHLSWLPEGSTEKKIIIKLGSHWDAHYAKQSSVIPYFQFAEACFWMTWWVWCLQNPRGCPRSPFQIPASPGSVSVSSSCATPRRSFRTPQEGSWEECRTPPKQSKSRTKVCGCACSNQSQWDFWETRWEVHKVGG